MRTWIQHFSFPFQSVADLERIYHFACAVITGLICAAAYLLFFLPLSMYFVSYERAIHEYQQQSQEMQNIQQLHSALNHTHLALLESINQCRERMKTSNAQIDFMASLQEIAESSQLSIIGYTPQTSVFEGSFKVHPLELELTGPYSGICQLLIQLHSMTQYLQIESMAMMPHPNLADTTKIVLQIRLYSLPSQSLNQSFQ